MDKQLVFDLLEYPICPVGNGDLVVFDSPGSLRQVALRGTEAHIVDVAQDQGKSPWLIGKRDVFLLIQGSSRELAFATEQFGPVVGGGDFYPSMLCGSLSDGSRAPVLGLNTRGGAWILEAAADAVVPITKGPLPVLLCSYWEEQGRPAFGGMSQRTEAPQPWNKDEYAAGAPLVLRVDVAAVSAERRIESRSLNELLDLDGWVRMAPSEVRDKPRFTKQVTPEVCVAGESSATGTRFAVALTGLCDFFDSLDVLGRYPANIEIYGLTFGRSAIEKVTAYQCAIASLRTATGHHLYVGENRGAGPRVGSLARVAMNDDAFAMRAVTVTGVDSSLRCPSFRPSFHPRIGYFGTLEARADNETSHAYFLHSDDGLSWNVVGQEGSVSKVVP